MIALVIGSTRCPNATGARFRWATLCASMWLNCLLHCPALLMAMDASGVRKTHIQPRIYAVPNRGSIAYSPPAACQACSQPRRFL